MKEFAEDRAGNRIHSAIYVCLRCKVERLVVLYKTTDYYPERLRQSQSRGSELPPLPTITRPSKVIKVGQDPPLSVSLPKGLEKNLGSDAALLYRRGLMCRNNGFGLAAVAYIRRIVEDKTNELIEVTAQWTEAHNLDPAEVAEIRAVTQKYTPYADKLKFAAPVLPSFFLVNGLNPLETLYGLVSKGIHELSEEACLEIADETRLVFEYIFGNLRAATDERKSYVGSLKSLTRKNSNH